jgi:PAS domain S-box-containing protein
MDKKQKATNREQGKASVENIQKRLRGLSLLVDPHPSVQDIGEKRRAQLLNVITLILSAAFILALLARPATVGTFIFLLSLSLASFVLGKTKYYKIGAGLFTLGFLTAAFLPLLLGTAVGFVTSVTSIVPLALIVASVLAGQREFLFIAIYATLATFLAPYYSRIETPDLVRTGGIVMVIGATLYGINAFRASVERARLKEVQDVNRELAAIQIGLEQRVAERTQALATVAEISTVVSTILETDKLLQEVVNLSKERFKFYHAHIYLLNEAGDTLVLASGAGEPGRRMVAEGRSIPLDREQSLVARAARERKGVTVNDVTQAPDFLPNPLLPDTRSELAVPMIVGENVIGVFDVQSDVIGRFTDADINIQTTLASQIAAAVQNARLYARAETSQQEVQSLVDYATEGLLVLDLETGLFTEPNESAAKLYGLPREELVKVGPAQMSPPSQPDGRDSTEKALERIGEAMQNGSAIFEWMHRNAQGQDFLCEIRLVRLPGAHPRLRVTITDITERKRIEELTRQRAQHQEALNLITQKIQSATTVEAAMQVAVRELGHSLGMQTSARLNPSASQEDRKTAIEKSAV